MKQNDLISHLTFSNILYVLLIALIPSFFLHYRINGFITMLIIILGIAHYITKSISHQKIGFIVLMPALFVVLILGQLYTNDLKTGWTLIERSLSVLLIPFATTFFAKSQQSQQKLLIDVLMICALVASIYCLGVQAISALETGSIYTTEYSTHFSFNKFMHHRLSAPLSLHAIYFSCYIAFINIYLFYQILWNSKNKAFNIGVFVFFSIMIFLLKSAIISFGFALVIIIMTTLKLIRTGNLVIRIGLSGILVLAICYMGFALKSKIEFINLNYDIANENMGMLAVRLSIWENALTIIRSNWLLGVGTGDADKALLEQYRNSGFMIGYENDFNCHNMYLQYWLGNGIAGIGLFIAYLTLLFKKAVKHKNMIFIGFLIIFALFSFTESTLRVQKGMVFFMIFSSLFYWQPTLWSNNR